MNKKVILICPYYTDKKTAASSYIDGFLSRLPKNLDYIFYTRKRRKCSKDEVSFYDLPLYRIVGYRFYTIILAIYYSGIRRYSVVTDGNPIISLPFTKKIYHIIHHIHDIPILGVINANTHQYSKLKAKFNLATLCWKGVLAISPKDIITVSKSEMKKIKEMNKSKEINVIRNLNQMELMPQSLKENSKSNFRYDIIMIGHNVKRKNYLFAVQAINSVSEQIGRKIKLCIVGNDTEKIKESVDLKTISISCYAKLSTNELHKLIVGSKFYLNTSYLEGYCIPFIECQTFGLIPIVPNYGVFHENCFSKHAYFSNLTLEEFTREIYNAFVNHSLLVSQSTENIDKKRQENFLNYNIIKEIDCFWDKIMSES